MSFLTAKDRYKFGKLIRATKHAASREVKRQYQGISRKAMIAFCKEAVERRKMKNKNIPDLPCTAGSMPRSIEDAKIGDTVVVHLKDGKSMKFVVDQLWEDLRLETEPRSPRGFDFATNEKLGVAGNYDFKHKTVELYLDCEIEDGCSICIESHPEMIRTDCVEFQNFDHEDQVELHLLRLLSLNMRKMTKDQKMNIIGAINKELGIRPLFKNDNQVKGDA